MRQVGPRPDPAPSRWAYRLQRLMLTPLFRRGLRIGLPFAAAFLLATAYLSDAGRQERLALALADLRHRIETRPEFMVDLLAVEGAGPETDAEIRELFPYELPASSFDLDLDGIRRLVEGLAAVAEASVRIRHDGVLGIEVSERQPAALWRRRDAKGLAVVDIDGVVIDRAAARSDRPGLPLVAGAGAGRAIPQALDVLDAAGALGHPVLGLVRMGERRWDVVLRRGGRILLPERQPVRALERVIVLDQVQDMLERDVAAVDMRLADRPTIRMNEAAVAQWRRVTAMTGTAE